MHSIIKHIVVFTAIYLTRAQDDCINILHCSVALKYVTQKIHDGKAEEMLRNAKCGNDGLLPKVRCNAIKDIQENVQAQATPSCIPVHDCPQALALIENNGSNPTVVELLRSLRCDNEKKQVHIKCGELAQKVDKGTTQIKSRITEIPKDACITPNGLRGYCVKLPLCPILFKKIQENSKYVKFAERSSCESGLVCCGADNEFDNECGVRYTPPSEDKIFGGNFSRIYENPWLVLLKYEDRTFKCAGTLINSQFVLTAAHCLTKKVSGVRVGDFIVDNRPDDHLDVKILKVKIHENFEMQKKDDDIALLKIERVSYNENVRWICLPPNSEGLPSKYIVTGYGDNDKGITPYRYQLKAQVPHVKSSECKNLVSYRNKAIDYDKVICAGGQAGIDACKGDSGGPLMSQNGDTTWKIFGIVSRGSVDCSAGIPALYTRVDRFLPWIRTTMLNMLYLD